jgi:hypothetical protein
MGVVAVKAAADQIRRNPTSCSASATIGSAIVVACSAHGEQAIDVDRIGQDGAAPILGDNILG